MPFFKGFANGSPEEQDRARRLGLPATKSELMQYHIARFDAEANRQSEVTHPSVADSPTPPASSTLASGTLAADMQADQHPLDAPSESVLDASVQDWLFAMYGRLAYKVNERSVWNDLPAHFRAQQLSLANNAPLSAAPSAAAPAFAGAAAVDDVGAAVAPEPQIATADPKTLAGDPRS